MITTTIIIIINNKPFRPSTQYVYYYSLEDYLKNEQKTNRLKLLSLLFYRFKLSIQLYVYIKHSTKLTIYLQPRKRSNAQHLHVAAMENTRRQLKGVIFSSPATH
jgi:hypothetical protein